MAKPNVINADEMGHVLGLLVHDLRNPAATISANVDFLQEVGLADTDSIEALQDVKLAVGELRRGLDMLAWISRWFTGQVPLEAANGDVGVFLAEDLVAERDELLPHFPDLLLGGPDASHGLGTRGTE